MYKMIPYESNFVHAEEDVINFSLVRQKINSYPRKEKYFGDDYSMVLLDEDHLDDTIIRGNRISERKNSVLSYLHIGLYTGDVKYRIKSIKTENVTNITSHKLT